MAASSGTARPSFWGAETLTTRLSSATISPATALTSASVIVGRNASASASAASGDRAGASSRNALTYWSASPREGWLSRSAAAERRPLSASVFWRSSSVAVTP